MTDADRRDEREPVIDFVAVLGAVSLDALLVLAPLRDTDEPDFRVHWANEAAAGFLGTTTDVLVGSRYRTWFPRGGRLLDSLTEASSRGEPQRGAIDYEPDESPISRIEYRIVPAGDHLALSVVDRSDARRASELAARLETMHRLGAEYSTAAAAIFRPVIGPDGSVVDLIWEYVNERAMRYLGRSAAETSGRRLTELIPLGAEQFLQPAEQCWRHQEALAFDLDVSETPISAEWLRFHLVPLADVVIAHAIDISGARLEEMALRTSEQRYRSLFETANEGIALVDRQGRFLLVNVAMAGLLGVEPDTLIGRELLDFLDESERERVVAEAAEATETGVASPRRQVRFRSADGTRWWGFAATSLVHDASGQHTGFEVMVVDVDAEFELELALRQREAQYRAVVDNAHAIIVLTDAAGTIEFVNHEAERVFGRSVEELAGRPSLELYAEEDRDAVVGDFRALVAGSTDLQRRRFVVIHREGTRVPCVGSAVALRDGSGVLDGVVLVGADITAMVEQEHARRELSAALAVAEQRERTRLASDLHDGPVQRLAALSMRLGAYGRAAAPDPALIEAAEVTVRETITELRTLMFQLTPPDLEGHGVGFVLADRATKLLGPDCAIRLDERWEQAPDAAVAQALFRVAHEAIVNVAKHAQADELRISLHQTVTDYLIEIIDNGIGGDPKHFEARSPEHLGVRGMIDRARQVGGRCEIESEPGRGTTVFIRMPVAIGGTD